MPKTLQQRLVAALKARGCDVVPDASRIHITLRQMRPTESWPYAEGTIFYIGKHGSLRRGKSYTDSIPASELFRKMLLAE